MKNIKIQKIYNSQTHINFQPLGKKVHMTIDLTEVTVNNPGYICTVSVIVTAGCSSLIELTFKHSKLGTDVQLN